ncbi:MAG: hypothetical protein LBH46_00140, partial [Rickettsiales bacterium]|nr:hypothetical protein [Rickettsiales bacterium]
MNKFLINVAALLIPKKKNRHHFREKYKNLDLFTLLYSRHSKVIGQTDKKINDNQTRINFN